MRPRRSSILIAVGLVTACQAPPAEAPDEMGTVELPSLLPEVPAEFPEAIDLVRGVLTFIESQESFAFRAAGSYDAIQDDGALLQFDLFQQVLVARPDRLAWVTVRDDATVDSVYFSNGTLSLLRQPDNIYGRIEVPRTIKEMIPVVSDGYGIDVPFGDFLAGDARMLFLEGLESSLYVGEAWLAPVWTRHVLLRKPEVDIQLWIAMGEQPLPVRVKMTWKNEPGAPSFTARFQEWRLNPPFSQDAFGFTVPEDAERVELVPRLDLELAGGEG